MLIHLFTFYLYKLYIMLEQSIAFDPFLSTLKNQLKIASNRGVIQFLSSEFLYNFLYISV